MTTLLHLHTNNCYIYLRVVAGFGHRGREVTLIESCNENVISILSNRALAGYGGQRN